MWMFLLGVLASAQQVDTARLTADVAQLCGATALEDGSVIRSRWIGHPDHELAGAWLEQRLEASGLQTHTQPFEALGHTGLRNLIADLPGAEPDLPWLVIGAHWDSVGSATTGWTGATDPAPGADDDASGVAAVLELARLLSAEPRTRSIRFVLFDAEEQGLVGSQLMAESMADEGMDVALMWSLDPIGYNASGLGNLWVTYDARWEDPARELEVLGEAGMLQVTAIDRELIGGGERSDQASFWDQGYPALHLAGWPQPPTYHTVDDTMEGVDADFMAAVTGLVLAQVDALAPVVASADGPVEPVESNQGCGCHHGGTPLLWVVCLPYLWRRQRTVASGDRPGRIQVRGVAS